MAKECIGPFSREKPDYIYCFLFSFFFFYHYSSRFVFPFGPRLNLRCIPELDRWIIKLIGVIAVAQMRSSTIDDYIKEGGSGYWLVVLLERPTLVRRVYGIHGGDRRRLARA